jgi:N-acetylglucosamine-6-phosphate deacetylase
MIVLTGADVVLPDRILSPGTVVVEGERITDVFERNAKSGEGVVHLDGHYILPGFIDAHVHGVEGHDILDGRGAVELVAASLPRFGVTAFCPTTVACSPAALRQVLEEVRQARLNPSGRSARVLPAHLESNFINPDFAGAQPVRCLRLPPAAKRSGYPEQREDARDDDGSSQGSFSAEEIVAEIERGRPDAGIVTLAPELDGAIDLIGFLVSRGHLVSLGHSAATYEEAVVAIRAGATRATHLFNRMPPFRHREPGLAGAVLQSEDVCAELICDGSHVHPAALRVAIAAKGREGVMAITDGTAVSGLAAGRSGRLGGRRISLSGSVALLEDGTLAGSAATMDRVFRVLINLVGLPLPDAAMLCSTTPARRMGLVGLGVVAPEKVADLVVLDRAFSVRRTYVNGSLVYSR